LPVFFIAILDLNDPRPAEAGYIECREAKPESEGIEPQHATRVGRQGPDGAGTMSQDILPIGRIVLCPDHDREHAAVASQSG